MNIATNSLFKLFGLSVFWIAIACSSAYAKEFDLFSDEATRPADYREKLVEIHDLTQKAIVYLGMPTMALMGDLDDAIDFGDSDYWEQARNTSVQTSFTCWGTGGYDVTLTRSDFRNYTGTVTASNCGSFGYVINGTVSFEYDDTVWSTEFRFRDDFPLVFSFTNVQIRGGDGELYTYTGKMQCDKKFNNASYYVYVDEAGIITELTYNLVESNGIPVHSEGELLFESDGSMSKSTLIDHYNCDFSDVSVTTQGQTHKINGIKFVTEYWYGPDTDPNVSSGGVGITTGRQERLSQIENEQYSLANKVTRSYFTHAEYGDYHFTNDAWPRYRSSSGGQGVWVELTDDGMTVEAVSQLDGFRFKPWSHAENDFLSVSKFYCDYNFNCSGEHFIHLSVLGSEEQFWARLNCDDDCEQIVNRESGIYKTRERTQFALYEGCGDFDFCGPRGFLDGEDFSLKSENDAYGGAMSDYFYADPATNTVRFNDFDEDGSVDEVDLDDDNDAVDDTSDAFPLDASEQFDTDNDGIGNNADKDDDGDGLSDNEETAKGTDPLKADSDGDGSNDNLDAFPLDASEQFDSDDDGIGDNGDNCSSVANASQTDTDNDGLGNACDRDDDNDGVNDTTDAFPLDASEQLDSDGDGTGNNSDNCLGLANSSQSNVDGDKNGDACDSDDDNDGVADSDDAFPKDATETVDTDGDGIGDNYDAAPLDPTVQKIGSRLPMWLLKAAQDKQAEQKAN